MTWHVGLNRALALQLFIPDLLWLVSYGPNAVSVGDKDQRNNNNIEQSRKSITCSCITPGNNGLIVAV